MIEFLINMGYKEKGIKKIVDAYSIKRYSEKTIIETIKKQFTYLKTIGFDDEEIIRMTSKYPQIFSFSEENINNKIKWLENMGYTKIHRMIKDSPNILGYNIETIQEKINYLLQLGFTKEDVIRITSNLANIFTYSQNKIDSTISILKNEGLSNEEIIRMIRTFPNIFCMDAKLLNTKIKDIESLGYDKKEVLTMLKKLPMLLGSRIETIKEKQQYLEEIGLESIMIIDTSKIMQSVELIYARYNYLKEKGYTIDITNYSKLFDSESHFKRQFGVEKKYLLEQYKYQRNEKTI